ncbi:hypothetical protein WCD74_18540 [Actinomycetospora sp. OC33-EN08]|uniref:FXSXX-COOH protein n=1 Tax=Actinomycetospora aurantiaca TaxID=3129233 RepID=A0ABU8MS37_9PSEU
MDAERGADDEFAEFDLDEAQLDAIMDRAEPAELVRRPQAAVTKSFGYGSAAVTRMASTGTSAENRTMGNLAVIPN